MKETLEELKAENARLKEQANKEVPGGNPDPKSFALNLSTYLNEMGSGLLLLNHEMKIMLINARAASLLGTTIQKAQDKPFLHHSWFFFSENGKKLEKADHPAWKAYEKNTSQAQTVFIQNHRTNHTNWAKIKARPFRIEPEPAPSGLLLILENENQSKKNELRLKEQLEMEKIVTSISTRFEHVEAKRLDDEIENALEKIGIHAGIDRSYLFIYNHEKGEMSNTHEWCNAGISKEIDNLKNLPKSLFPWWNQKIEKKEYIHLHTLDDLPEAATEEKKILEAQNIQSLLVVPVFSSGMAAGFIGFDSVKSTKSWSSSDIRMLRILADIFGNTLKRIEAQQDLRKSEAKYRSLIESTSSSVLVADKAGIIHFANAVAQKKWNLLPGNIPGEKISSLLPSGQEENLLNDIRRVLATKTRIKNEAVFSFSDEKRWYRTATEPLDEGGKTSRKALIFFDDIDREKKNRLLIEQLNQRLKALNKIDKAIISQLDNNNFFQTALTHLYHLIPCNAIVFATLDYEKKSGEAKAVVLNGEPNGQTIKTFEFQDINWEILGKNTPLIKNLRKENLDSNFQQWIYQKGIRNYLLLPVHFEKKPFGALILLSKENHFFSAEHTEIVNEISQQIVIGYQQILLKEQIQQQNKNLERLVEKRTREKDEIAFLNNAIVNTTGTIIFSVDPDGMILTMNPEAEKLLGYEASEVVKRKTIYDFYNPRDLSSLFTEWQKKTNKRFKSPRELFIHIAENDPSPFEFTLIKKNGELLPVLLSINAIRDESGTVRQYAGVATNLTDKKKAEQALHLQKVAFENFAYGLVITDPQGKIIWANSAYEQLTGFSFKESLGKKIEELQKSGRESLQFYEKLWNTIRKGKIWKGEIINKRKDGHLYPEDLTITPIKNQRGKITHFVAVKIDISAKKNQEKYSLIQRDLGFSLATAKNLEEALNIVLENILKIETIHAAGIYLTDPETGDLELKTSAGLSADFLKNTQRYAPGTPEYTLVKKGVPVYQRYAELKLDPSLFQKENLQQIGIIPIKFNDRVIGSLNVASRLDKASDNPVKITLESTAAQIGSALSRIHSQDALLNSQKNFRLMFDTLEDFLFIADFSGEIIRTNPVVQKKLGYTEKELKGMNLLNLHPPERREEAQKIVQDMLAGKRVLCPVPLYTKNKKQIPVETKVVLGKWEGQNALYGISRDISERLKAEKKIRSSEARWQFALESSGDGIWDWNLKTNNVYYSPQWIQMLGFEAGEISGSLQEWEKRIHPDDKQEVLDCLEAHKSGESPLYKNEHRLLCKDGKYKWILDRGKIISWDASGNPERMIGTHTDISARKNFEDSMKQALQKEKELGELKSQFVSMASHEFRTPLSTMIMAAETLEYYWHKMSPEEISKKIKRIKNNVEFLRNIIEKTLSLSRLQSGKLKFVPVETELNAFLKGIVETQKTSHPGHTTLFTGTDKGLKIKIDPQMMKQVLNNILANSYKYSAAGTTVTLRVSRQNTTVSIKITDEGIGIPDAEQEKVFDAFQRCSNVGNIHGTGLGMALASQFVGQHQGNITFHSEMNKGTTFTVSLPVISG